MNIFLDQQADPEQGKKENKQHSEYDPAGCRNAPLDLREELAHTVGTAIATGHEMLTGRRKRSRS